MPRSFGRSAGELRCGITGVCRRRLGAPCDRAGDDWGWSRQGMMHGRKQGRCKPGWGKAGMGQANECHFSEWMEQAGGHRPRGPVLPCSHVPAVIPIQLFITAQHGGRHFFRFCPSHLATKECFKRATLRRCALWFCFRSVAAVHASQWLRRRGAWVWEGPGAVTSGRARGHGQAAAGRDCRLPAATRPQPKHAVPAAQHRTAPRHTAPSLVSMCPPPCAVLFSTNQSALQRFCAAAQLR